MVKYNVYNFYLLNYFNKIDKGEKWDYSNILKKKKWFDIKFYD
jgi:hypothetical protein